MAGITDGVGGGNNALVPCGKNSDRTIGVVRGIGRSANGVGNVLNKKGTCAVVDTGIVLLILMFGNGISAGLRGGIG